MKIKFIIVLLCFSNNLIAQTGFKEKTISKSKVKMTFNSFGIFGNAFRGQRNGTGSPSCAYPDSLAIEHMFEGGLWVGGKMNGSESVSTSSLDVSQGFAAGRSGFEFTNRGNGDIMELSNQDTSIYFDSSAIAAQQFQYKITDGNVIIPGTSIQIQNHTAPLSVDLDVRLLNFFVEENHSIVYVEVTAINKASAGGAMIDIDSLYFGVYLNAVVRNLNATPAGSGGAAFYNKGGNGFLTAHNAAYTYDYSGDVGRTNTYIAQQILGVEDKNGFHHPSLDSSYSINYNTWTYNSLGPGLFQAPPNDGARFKKMSNGIQDDPCWLTNFNCGGGGTFQEQLNSNGNRSDLISIGPVLDFDGGDTVTFTFAFVLAQKLDDGNAYTDNTIDQRKELTDRLTFAQNLYNGEDLNFNGILDAEEDKDKNGKITRYYYSTVGVQENRGLEKLKFQNPNSGNLLIDLSNQKEKIKTIQILDLTGKVILEKNSISNRYVKFNIANFSQGTYLIRTVSISYQQNVEKLIKI